MDVGAPGVDLVTVSSLFSLVLALFTSVIPGFLWIAGARFTAYNPATSGAVPGSKAANCVDV